MGKGHEKAMTMVHASACILQDIIEACGKFREHKRCVRAARGKGMNPQGGYSGISVTGMCE